MSLDLVSCGAFASQVALTTTAPRPVASYRPALDGIRAAAVLSVLAYHLGTGLRGGFLGVDIFFVLSGYLITGLLLGQDREGGIRFAAFWAARARRLLPALFVLVAVAAIVTPHVASMATFDARRGDLTATLFYYANWHFVAADESYFTAYTGISPLRHMWSLAIEEQFYVLWPLLLASVGFAARRRKLVLLGLIVAGAVGSLVDLAFQYDAADPSRAYYGTDTRAYQLLIGAALATLVATKPGVLDSPRARRIAGPLWIPVTLSVAAFVVLQGDHSRFYYRGGGALFAVLVAVGLWVVETRPQSPLSRVLSFGPVRWIGVLSYGLYLWHWPLIVWIGVPSSASDPILKGVVEVVVLFAVATASYCLVERPVRRGEVPWLRLSPRRLIPATLVCAAGTLTLIATLEPHQAYASSDSPCPKSSPGVGDARWCVRTPGTGPRPFVVAVAGDSTSRALNPGMMKVAKRRGWRYIQAGVGGCSILPLVLPNDYRNPTSVAQAKRCVTTVPAEVAQVEARARPDLWIVSDRFAIKDVVTPSGRVLRVGDRARDKRIEVALLALLRRLTAHGKHAVIIGQPPQGEPVDCIGHATEQCYDKQYTVWDQPTARLDLTYRRVAFELPRVVYVSVTDVVCPGRARCPAAIAGTVVRYDTTHWTVPFSETLVPIMIQRAERAIQLGG